MSLFFPRLPCMRVHNAHAGPFSRQTIPFSNPCTYSTNCPPHDPECACVYERPQTETAHTYTCANRVFKAYEIVFGLKRFDPGGAGAFNVDVKLPSHLSLPLSSASCCSPFLSILLPSFFLPSFLPHSLPITHTHSLSKSYISTHRSLRSQHSSDARLITAAGSADKSV